MSKELETFEIAFGTHRGQSKNDVWTRKKLWKKLEKPLHDTSVSFAQYSALSVDEKGRKKAAAGWYKGGHYKDGLRKLPNLLGLSFVALDLDNLTPAQLENIRMGLVEISRWDWFMHTTRSHCPERPRVRLIIFLDRMVNLDEANALARYLALELADDPAEAIEIPDQVSFRNNQISYWPSISRDQDYWTDRNDGETLCVDDYLAEHPTWQDVSTLPMQEGETHAGGADPNRKMEDPREKQGLIGAFCRAYDIEEAIAKFIPNIYVGGESSGSDTRYTYVPGSGANGAVVYDDGLFIHSNHGTDPIEGSANAWDMVRIHLFGHLDDKAHGNTSPGNMPSFKAMVERAKTDRAVQVELAEEYFPDDEDEDGYGDVDGGEPEDDIDTFLGLNDDDRPSPKKKKKAKERLTLVERMNRDHAFVHVGRHPAIADFRSPNKVEWRSAQGFQLEHQNREIKDGTKTKTLGTWWLSHPERRSYPLGIAFRPDGKVPKGMLNLWTGWAIEPDETKDCQFVLDYIWRILANQNQRHYDYILTWLADIVQNPGQKPGVALVLKGRKGAGKDTVVEIMRRIVGDRHRAKLTDTKMIGDKFNAAFEVALIAQLEEASWGGHMDTKGTLQSYITSPTIRIERKGVDAIEIDSFVRLVFTANEDWVVPATADERRYAVFDVCNERAGPKHRPFWLDFYRRLDSGGAEGFLAYLLTWETPDYIDVRVPPQTKALSDQKLAGLRGVDLWWFEALHDNEVPGDIRYSKAMEGDEDRDMDDAGWEARPITVEIASVRAAYDEWRKNHRYKAPYCNPAKFGQRLRDLCPPVARVRVGGRGNQAWCYQFPTLDECRAEFAAAQNVSLADCGFPDFGGGPEPETGGDESDEDEGFDLLG